jgi:hypothetical protein
MKKISWIFALLAALTVVFVGCTEAGASFDTEEFWNAAVFSGAEAFTNNNGGTTPDSKGVFNVSVTTNYEALVTFKFDGGIQPGASNFVIDYIADVPGKTKWTGKVGYKSGTGTWYGQSFKSGLNQLVVPVERVDSTGFSIEMAEVTENEAFKIKFLAASWQ